MHVLYSPFVSRQGVTSMPFYEAGVTEGPPPSVAPGDVVELQVYDDEGASQGTVLVGVWRQAGTYKGGAVIEGRFLGASDLYDQWWMNSDEDAPNILKAWYHLCAQATVTCPEATKYKRMVHSDRYRNLGAGAPTARRVPWLADKVLKEGVDEKYKRFVEAGGGPPKSPGDKKTPATTAAATWAEDGDGEDEDEESLSSSQSDDKGMKAKIADLKAQLKKAEKETQKDKDDKKRKKRRHQGTDGPVSQEAKRRERRAPATQTCLVRRETRDAGAGARDPGRVARSLVTAPHPRSVRKRRTERRHARVLNGPARVTRARMTRRASSEPRRLPTQEKLPKRRTEARLVEEPRWLLAKIAPPSLSRFF